MGSTSSFRTKHDRATIDSTQRAPFIQFGDVFTDAPKAGEHVIDYRRLGMVVISKSYPFEKRGNETPETFAGVPAEVEFCFFASRLADWDLCAAPARERSTSLRAITDALIDAAKKGRPLKTVPAISVRGFIDEERSAAKKIILGEIAASFSQREFSIVVLALREKYGEPNKTESAIKQNGAGASFTSESLVWLIGEDRIEAVERDTRVDRSRVRIKRPAVTETANGIFTESTKKAAADL